MLSLLLATLHVSSHIEITHDRYGVPSIFAQTDADAAYGLGYEQALNMGQQMATSYKLARGRYAEVVGKNQLLTDGFIRSLGIEEAAEKTEQSPSADQTLVDSFLEGANRGIAECKAQNKIPSWVEKFTRTDVYALIQFVNAGFPLMDFQASLSKSAGSNQFAIAPQRTATGHPILSIDPHLSLNGADLIIWFEFAQYTPQGQFRGVSIPGLPTGLMGHTDRIAWSQTNNDPILTTRFKVVVNPNNSSEYSFHGEWKRFGLRTMKLNFLEDGQLKTRVQTVKTTEWGPMIPLRNEALACPIVGRTDSFNTGSLLTKARSVAEVRAVLAKRTYSMWNFVFADVDGNIGYQYNALLPSRNPDYNWRGVVPGNDPNTKLGDLIPNDDLPHVVNPKSGFLANCNSAPWLTAPSGEIPDKWPNFITTYGHTTRYDRLSELLKQNRKVTVEKAKQIATDTMVPYGKQTAMALVAAGAAQNASNIFKRWDGRAEIRSVGTALYAYWLRQDNSNYGLTVAAGEGKPWSPEQAKSAVDSLKRAEDKLVAEHGKLSVQWGDILFMERGQKQVPTGGYGYLRGSLAAVRPSSPSSTLDLIKGRIRATRGSSVRMIVSLEPGKVHSWSVLPYGNSWNADSPHYADQMELYAAGKYKDSNFGPQAARRAAVDRVTLER